MSRKCTKRPTKKTLTLQHLQRDLHRTCGGQFRQLSQNMVVHF